MLLVNIRSVFLWCLIVGMGILVPTYKANAQAPGSPKDPFYVHLKDRAYSETPVPCGIIVGLNPELSASVKSRFNYSVDGYYDAWQLGYHSEDYGNVVKLQLRSLGRDEASGFYIEYGSGNSYIDSSSSLEDGGNSTVATNATYSVGLIGAGVNYMIGFGGKGVRFEYLLDVGVGQASGTLAGSDAGGVYVHGAIGAGARIPISTMALSLIINYYISYMPAFTPRLLGASSSDGDKVHSTNSGFAITARYAFNFNG